MDYSELRAGGLVRNIYNAKYLQKARINAEPQDLAGLRYYTRAAQ